ncbi:MAG: hypothetical protein Ct9H300mP16_14460 [Pseudomonadota bacterium]|nr:MAG: hypothetical protein Ct9H300mP16_14460 [Pseudomonadota bacterium]
MCFDFIDIDCPAIHLIAPAFKRRVHQRLGTTLLAPHRRLPHKIHRKTELGFKSPGYRVKNLPGQFFCPADLAGYYSLTIFKGPGTQHGWNRTRNRPSN